MANALEKVTAGRPIALTASTWNAFIDGVAAVRRLEKKGGGLQSPSPEIPPVVLIQNISGANVAQFGILSLATPVPLVLPSVDLGEFQREVALTAGAPTSNGQAFAVMLEALTNASIGKAVVAGACPVTINVSNASHTKATTANTNTAQLVSSADEGAVILWKESGTGAGKRAVVLMPACCPTVAASGGITGTLTNGAIPVGTATNTLGDSWLTQSANTITLTTGKTLALPAGAVAAISGPASIESGGVFTVKSGGSETIASGGSLVVKSGGTLTTEAGSTATLNSPTLVTPILGVAAATSINKVAITAPAASATLTIADGKTLTATQTITLTGTDATVMTFPTTSATIARTDAPQTFTGVQTMTSPVLAGVPSVTGIVIVADSVTGGIIFAGNAADPQNYLGLPNSSAALPVGAAPKECGLAAFGNAANGTLWFAVDNLTVADWRRVLFTGVRVVTAAGAVTLDANADVTVVVNKTVGAATTVNLPAGAAVAVGFPYTIKDGKGDAATNAITLTPAAGNIDGAATFVMATNYQSMTIVYNGTQWNCI